MLHYVDEVATSNLGSRATGEQGRRRGVGVFVLFLLLLFFGSEQRKRFCICIV